MQSRHASANSIITYNSTTKSSSCLRAPNFILNFTTVTIRCEAKGLAENAVRVPLEVVPHRQTIWVVSLASRTVNPWERGDGKRLCSQPCVVTNHQLLCGSCSDPLLRSGACARHKPSGRPGATSPPKLSFRRLAEKHMPCRQMPFFVRWRREARHLPLFPNRLAALACKGYTQDM